MKQSKQSGKKKHPSKKGGVRARTEDAGIPANPDTIVPPPGPTPPGAADANSEFYDTTREEILSPLGTPQAGFGEFIDDEWDEDQDIADDFLRARDNAAFGDQPTPRKDFLEDGER